MKLKYLIAIGILLVAVCFGTVTLFGHTYTLTVSMGFGTQRAECSVKLPVKFTDPAKLKPSVTIKASGFIDVIRPDSAVIVTPTMKNISSSPSCR